MTRTVAVANQKGGVAKTTTVASLATALAERGLRVLVVDLDPQGCLTFSFGLDPDLATDGVPDLLDGRPAAAVVHPVRPRIGLVPATVDLAAAEEDLAAREDREHVLARALAPAARDADVVLLDCSPSLGLLTLGALAAADELVVPMACEMLAHRAVGQTLDTVADVRRVLGHPLLVRGVLPTLFDARAAHCRAVLADVRERYGVPVLDPPVPRSLRVAQAPATGRTVLESAPRSPAARAYRQLADGLLAAWGTGAAPTG